MFHNILVPTDGSLTGMRAAAEVAEMVVPTSDTKVTILIAISPLNGEETDFDPDVVARHNESMRRKADEALEKTARVFSIRGITYDTKVVEGDPVSLAIAREVEAGRYDLIAMGSRGLGMQKNSMHYLGSVTEHVIQRVNVPVMVIPVHQLSKGRDEQ